MRKFNLELPKYRLQLHMRLVKRRKPLIVESIIPTVKAVNRKYRKGTFLGKIARHFGDHSFTRKFFAANFAVFAIAGTLIPSVKASTNFTPDQTVIEVQNPIETQKGIQFPLENYKINQGYSFFHPALDLGASVGTPIEPVKPGTVTYAGFSYDGYGNHIVIDHGKGVESLYAHLSKIEVKVGQEVDMNTEIGKVGLTGHTTGPHLHLEIHQDGKSINPLVVLSR